jgi:hypothetical protein
VGAGGLSSSFRNPVTGPEYLPLFSSTDFVLNEILSETPGHRVAQNGAVEDEIEWVPKTPLT